MAAHDSGRLRAAFRLLTIQDVVRMLLSLVVALGFGLGFDPADARPRRLRAKAKPIGREIERLQSKSTGGPSSEDREQAEKTYDQTWEKCNEQMQRPSARRPQAVYDVGLTIAKDRKDRKFTVAGTERDARRMAKRGKCPDRPKGGLEEAGKGLAKGDGTGEIRVPITFKPPRRSRLDRAEGAITPGMQ